MNLLNTSLQKSMARALQRVMWELSDFACSNLPADTTTDSNFTTLRSERLGTGLRFSTARGSTSSFIAVSLQRLTHYGYWREAAVFSVKSSMAEPAQNLELHILSGSSQGKALPGRSSFSTKLVAGQSNLQLRLKSYSSAFPTGGSTSSSVSTESEALTKTDLYVLPPSAQEVQ